MQFSSGYRFCPTEQELIGHYLFNKIAGKSTPVDDLMVQEVDLYGEEQPWEIWERFGGERLLAHEHLFLFTNLKKKNGNGARIDRTVGNGNGTWHGEDTGIQFTLTVKNNWGDDIIKGFKKRFQYRNPGSIHHGGWIMREYSLCVDNTDYVLCTLKKNDSFKAKRKSVMA